MRDCRLRVLFWNLCNKRDHVAESIRARARLLHQQAYLGREGALRGVLECQECRLAVQAIPSRS